MRVMRIVWPHSLQSVLVGCSEYQQRGQRGCLFDPFPRMPIRSAINPQTPIKQAKKRSIMYLSFRSDPAGGLAMGGEHSSVTVIASRETKLMLCFNKAC